MNIRGIQPGTTTWDNESRELDGLCRKVKNILTEEMHKKYKDLKCLSKLPQEMIPGNVGSCSPDGGLWFYNDKLVLAFEGKKQNDAGNAIERWYKNHYICRKINPSISYLTFASGQGAKINGVIWKTLHIAHLDGGLNTYCPRRNSLFFKIDGFTIDECVNIVREAILERIVSEEA